MSQRLIPSKDGKRVAAFEILLGTPLVCDMIKRGDVAEIKQIMEKSTNLGMQTFDQALYDLYMAGHITEEEALRNADSANNLRLRISLNERGPEPDAATPAEDSSSGPSLSLVLDDDEEEENQGGAQFEYK